MEVRPGNILVAVRDPTKFLDLRDVLSETDTTTRDVVVMTARVYHREPSFSGSSSMESSEIFEQYERELFSAVVSTAELGNIFLCSSHQRTMFSRVLFLLRRS